MARRHGLTALLAVLALAAAGCSTTAFETKKVDYKSAGKLPPLEVPPDLTAPTSDERFVVPDISPSGTATYSVYARERSGQGPQAAAATVAPVSFQDQARIERSGSQRWLVVRGTPEQVWPVVKDFWQELGFLIKIENPDAGIIETDWAENRAKIPQDFIRATIGKLIDGLYSTAERDKFRTRLERSAEGGATEIYVSHRGMYEVLEGEGGSRTIWQPRPSDPELEAEMLSRMMVRFGVQEARAKALLASTGGVERAKLTRESAGGGHLVINEPFDRAWRRVGLALDRVGFTVEDRDRSKGVYFVRYADVMADAKKDDKGWLSKLTFWSSDDKKAKPEQYRIAVRSSGEASRVEVLNKDGNPERSETATRILNLLYEQLK